ncbi:MAG: phosphotransferase [Polyangia bacterium]|jgi:Ser/Thr protein kinase RdoA (MazF antagonist)
MTDIFEQVRERVLSAYPGLGRATVAKLGNGLINQTFLVVTEDARFVLQRLAPALAPEINDNIAAVTCALTAAGLVTPHLVPTADGRRCLDLGPSGVWRLQTHVPGWGFDRLQSPAQAYSASALIGRFHRALRDLQHRFVGLRAGAHDTARHLARLEQALTVHAGHRLLPEVSRLARALRSATAELQPLPALPMLIGHGDLKLNNVLFAGDHGPAAERAVCLIDLDTVGPVALAYEIGDALRSWCNPSGEDSADAIVDLEAMQAAVDGYAAALARALSEQERLALLLGVEWISLELSCRFAADALDEAYFGWDPRKFPTRGEHNLVRARGQLALHQAWTACRQERRRLLGL